MGYPPSDPSWWPTWWWWWWWWWWYVYCWRRRRRRRRRCWCWGIPKRCMRRSPKRCTRRIPKRDPFPHFHPKVSSLSKNPPFFLHPGLAVPHRSLQGAARSDHAPGKPALDPALGSAGFQVLPRNSGETSNSPIRIRIIVIFQLWYGKLLI